MTPPSRSKTLAPSGRLFRREKLETLIGKIFDEALKYDVAISVVDLDDIVDFSSS